jgi:hypothetical protein
MSTAIATGCSGKSKTDWKSPHKREVTRTGRSTPLAIAHRMTNQPPLQPSTPATQSASALAEMDLA